MLVSHSVGFAVVAWVIPVSAGAAVVAGVKKFLYFVKSMMYTDSG